MQARNHTTRFPLTAALAVVLVLVAAPAGPGGVPVDPASGQRLVPVADTYVDSAKPRTNYGRATRLKADDSPLARAYLRFRLDNLNGSVRRATLWLYAVTGSNDGYVVHGVPGNSWDESSIRYANAPPISETTIGSSGAYSSGAWTSVDVTSLVTASGLVSLAVTTPGPAALSVASRESGAKSPLLIVETASSDTTAPTAPGALGVSGATGSSVSFSWLASNDDVGVVGYGVYRDGALLGSAAQTSYTVSELSCGTSYTVAVDAYDAAGNRSERASLLTATNPCPSRLWQPAPGTTWQWQITGRVDETVQAQMFDVDMTDASPGGENAGIVDRLHARGIIAICYLDTGAWESYRPDAGEFPASLIGNSTGWSGERWLDIRAAAWPQFASIIWRRLDLAKSLGCDGVEPDQNNPVGNNPGFPITLADQKAWYLEVARQAHLRGLSVGMKNGIETVDADTVSAFDWALNEECFQYNECGVMSQFINAGKAVFQTEYLGESSSFCAQANSLRFSSMKKNLSLDAWRETCW